MKKFFWILIFCLLFLSGKHTYASDFKVVINDEELKYSGWVMKDGTVFLPVNGISDVFPDAKPGFDIEKTEIGGVGFVKIRDLCSAIGYAVSWEPNQKTVIIETKCRYEKIDILQGRLIYEYPADDRKFFYPEKAWTEIDTRNFARMLMSEKSSPVWIYADEYFSYSVGDISKDAENIGLVAVTGTSIFVNDLELLEIVTPDSVKRFLEGTETTIRYAHARDISGYMHDIPENSVSYLVKSNDGSLMIFSAFADSVNYDIRYLRSGKSLSAGMGDWSVTCTSFLGGDPGKLDYSKFYRKYEVVPVSISSDYKYRMFFVDSVANSESVSTVSYSDDERHVDMYVSKDSLTPVYSGEGLEWYNAPSVAYLYGCSKTNSATIYECHGFYKDLTQMENYINIGETLYDKLYNDNVVSLSDEELAMLFR